MTLTSSFDICEFSDHGSECGELLQRADAAQARVKVRGGNGLAFFESAMNEDAQRRLQLVSALRRAIREDQLLPQPSRRSLTDLARAQTIIRGKSCASSIETFGAAPVIGCVSAPSTRSRS